MKLALITSPGGGPLITEFGLAYHMALAQYVLSDEAYAECYRTLHGRGHFIMLDNGAAENGRSMSVKQLCLAAKAIGADEIVMPDVLDNCLETIAATQGALDSVPVRMRAVVPQGVDWEDWEYCAKKLVSMGCRTICIAKRYERLPGRRAQALDIIRSHDWHTTYDVHLLGCHRNPLKEICDVVEDAPWVRGIDTAAPIAYAQHAALLTDQLHYSFEWGAPFDPGVAEFNVGLALEACKCM